MASAPWLSSWFQITRGFQRFHNPSEQAEALATMAELPISRLIRLLLPRRLQGDDRAQALTDTALAWWAEPRTAPLFLWVRIPRAGASDLP